jgi:competence protein ComEC
MHGLLWLGRASRGYFKDESAVTDSTPFANITLDRWRCRSVALAWAAACITLLPLASTARAATATLDIYFIDVEGGQSTLMVTPGRQSLLIDTGWAGNGSGSPPGDPQTARDARRIIAAARDAGITQIDYLLITHFHPDHDGGVVELAQLIPIRHFIDHGTLPTEAAKDSGTRSAYQAYLDVRNKAPHSEPRPGDRLPLKDVEAVIVASAAAILGAPLAIGGQVNSLCAPSAPPARDPIENPRSTGFVATFGRFRFLDVGDLSGQPLYDLACPKSLIGPVDVYLVAHHGGPDAADPATFAAFKPRVAVMNNGLKKGGARETYETLHHVSGLEDVWQLHRSEAAHDRNFPLERIANPDESTAYWLKLSARPDGSFRVLNARTGESKQYPAK